MREIKFRVFDKSRKNMNNYPSQANMFSNGQIVTDRFIWMQYIGLKDKRGKEIYEGDIVSDGTEPKPYIVQFVVKGWCSTFELKHTTKSWSYSGKGLKLEVIGNIYENPELLEDKQ